MTSRVKSVLCDLISKNDDEPQREDLNIEATTQLGGSFPVIGKVRVFHQPRSIGYIPIKILVKSTYDPCRTSSYIPFTQELGSNQRPYVS
jgi:hypothetical protein